MSDLYSRFANLFKGNTRSFGRFYPSNSRMETIKSEPTIENFTDHIDCKTGIGSVAILDDGKCHWGAIDIDNHSGTDINIQKITKDVHDQGLPLVVCESKSGGAHCYLFCKEKVQATYVRNVLVGWAADLGHAGAEVFPKQTKLLKDKETNQLQLGNWINLPYFGDTRQAVVFEGGNFRWLPLTDFVSYAESSSVDQKTVEEFIIVDHPKAPPCIQAIIRDGVDTGHRNETIYNLTVYMRKAFPDEFRDRVHDLNQRVFSRPLSYAEAKKTIESAARRDYKYKCMEEPCRSNCDSEVCLTREFGISEEDVEGLSRSDFPEITSLKIYDMDPPIWEMEMGGQRISMSTAQLYNYASFAQVVMERLLIVLPPLKNKDWMNKLAGMMSIVEREDTPEDASIPGVIKGRLREFLYKADLKSDGNDTDQRSLIKRGIPVVQSLGVEGLKGRHIVFKGMDFVSYLKRTKSEELKGSSLWNSMKHWGVEHSRIRIDGKVTQVWTVPLDDNNRTVLDLDYGQVVEVEEPRENVANFKSEF